MKYLIVILVFIFVPLELFSQSISVSPYSFEAWGQTESVSEVSFSYKNVGAHYYVNTGNEGHTVKKAFAVSYKPISIKNVLEGGVILFDRPFPVGGASQFNFIVGVGYSFDGFRISYRHISNGFGILNEINPGLDSIRISFRIN